MRVAFYAPLKPADHPTPSGDRLMARLLVKAMAMAGHDVQIASQLRTYAAEPDETLYRALKSEAQREAARLIASWSPASAAWIPDCWFTYHPYYRSPDWIGPEASARFGIPYVTAEASYAPKRDRDGWRIWQDDVVAGLRQASASFCYTTIDHEGLQRLELPGKLVDLPPFIDPPPQVTRARRSTAAPRIATIGMMRRGNKLDSYLMLAEALKLLLGVPWRLAVMGDGPARADVLAAFSAIPPDRIDWLGQVDDVTVAAELSACDLYVWPGVDEAYGVSYLEAQAMGLPVVAQDTTGVPAVVENGTGGWLTPAGDLQAFVSAIHNLLTDSDMRAGMGSAAAQFVREKRGVPEAAARIGAVLAGLPVQERRA